MSKDNIKNLNNERNFLAGLLRYPESLYEIESFIQPDDFASEDLGKIYTLLRHIIIENQITSLDSALILSFIEKRNVRLAPQLNVTDYINKLFVLSKGMELKTVAILAKEIVLLSRKRDLFECGTKLQKKMLDYNFTSLVEVMAASDEVYFECMRNFSFEDDMVELGSGAQDELNRRADNPVEHVGFSSGFKRWDELIGYFRPDMLSFVSARAKAGKSMFALNVAVNVVKQGIPVLYLDSELSHEEMRDRLVALFAGVDIKQLETGKWRSDKETCRNVEKAFQTVDKLGIKYQSIRAGNVDSNISACRRFLFKHVKRTVDGNFNRCLIIYDYLKLDYSSSLGDTWHLNLAKTVVNFKDFLGQTKATGLLLGQQNRSGIAKFDSKSNKTITNETEETVAGSDEVVKTSSNVSSLRFKTPEELKADGTQNGNVCLTPIVCRHGKGSLWCSPSEGVFVKDYVSFECIPHKMTFREVCRKSDIIQQNSISSAFK